MVDSGATDLFLDTQFVRKHEFELVLMDKARELRIVDGSVPAAGPVSHYTEQLIDFGGHTSIERFYITDLGGYDMIIGKSFLRVHNPFIDWENNRLCFNKEYCRQNCLQPGCYQLLVKGLPYRPRKPKPKPPTTSVEDEEVEEEELTKDTPRIPRRVSAREFESLAQDGAAEIFALSLHDLCEELGESTPYIVNLRAPRSDLARETSASHDRSSLRTMEKQIASDHTVCQTPPRPSKHSLLQQLDCMILEPEPEIFNPRAVAAEMYLAGASLEDVQKALEDKTPIDPATKLPQHYHRWIRAFSVEDSNVLPKHRDCDHKIELIPGKTPKACRAYPMSHGELKVLRKWLQENLEKGFIRPSTSPAASPVLFAKKPGGGLRFCVDYRALNAITVKNRYPIPLIQETLHNLSKAKYYTKLDIISAFNKIRVEKGQEWLTAFMTRYGLFESLVMPFGLCNAPATFQTRINEVLHPYLDVFCTAYIDDVLIYSDNLEEHRIHVGKVLQALQDADLQLDIKKCEFEVEEVGYLGMIIGKNGVRMDPAKVQAVVEWASPTSVKDVQAFLGFANFYRRFIKGFSRITKPLVDLTKKSTRWSWSDRCQEAFQLLKDSFTQAPILRHFDPERQVFIETDASDYVSSGILSQKDDDGVLHPVAFMSKKHSPAECNYEIYDKELLAIIRCFEGWRSELEGAAFPITVLSDHRNLMYFMTTKQLTRRQVRWAEFLSEFDFEISFVDGKSHGKPDAFTRRSQDLPQSKDDPRLVYQNKTLLPQGKDEALVAAAAEIIEHDFTSESLELTMARLLDEGYDLNENNHKKDEFWVRIHKEMTKKEGIPRSKEVSLSECRIVDGRLYFRDRLYLPGSELQGMILKCAHDSGETGHPGKNALYEQISRDYWWPRLNFDCKKYCKFCHTCKRNKTSKLRYQGALKPLPIPAQRWRNISVDFVGALNPSNGFDQVMVVIDRLSKERHYVSCKTTQTAAQLADLFVRHIWKLHGLPDSIISDRDKLFVSEFWQAICSRLNISADLSSSRHPETDGQTEIANAFMEQYLRMFINLAQSDWDDWLPLAEFAANNAVSASTQMSPFFATRGYHPRMSFGPPRSMSSDASKGIKQGDAAANAFVQKMEDILALLQTNLVNARAEQEEDANKTRDFAPAYQKGDEVFLSTRDLTTDRPMKKLDVKFMGPFPIKKVLNSHAYQLELPWEWQSINNAFHTNLLLPAETSGVQGQTNPPPPAIGIDINGEKLWAIDAILDSRRTRSGFEYEIKWRDGSTSWQPLVDVVTAHASIREFVSRYPKKKKPTKREKDKAKRDLARFMAKDDEGEEVIEGEVISSLVLFRSKV